MIIIICLSSLGAAAQDTEFWFVAPQLDDAGMTYTTNFNRPVYFMITAGDSPATVTMEMPALTGFGNRVLHLAANQSERIIFGTDYTAFSNAQMDTIQNNIRNPLYVGVKYNRGIRFTSTAPVSIYYQVDSYNSKDMFALKGAKALGTEFYTPFQTLLLSNNSYPHAYAQFHIVAADDGTSVQITPAADIVGTAAGTTITVNLDRGETFAARSNTYLQATRLAGSHIVSNKPVAVTVCDDLLNADGAADVTGDQLVPTDNLGTAYTVVRGFSSTQNTNYCDHVFILATQNGTGVSVNGASVGTLNAGQQYTHTMQTDQTAVITSTHPVYVYQLSGHGTGVGSEYGAVLVPSMYAINSRRISFYKDAVAYNNNVFVLVREGNEDGFTVNGSASVLLAGDFMNIPNITGWKYARKNIQGVASGTVTVANSKGAFSLGYFYTGATGGTSASFGYFSKYEDALFFADTTWMCNNAPVTLDPGYAQSYYWTLPDGSHPVTPTVVAADTGTYTVVINTITTISTKVLNRFEGSGIISSGTNDIGGGAYTYTADVPYNDNNISYTWTVDGVQAGTAKTFSTTWNSDDEHEITLTMHDNVLNCTKTHTLIHHKLPDNVTDAQCYTFPDPGVWSFKQLYRSSEAVFEMSVPLVGDIDNDGKVEIVCAGQRSTATANFWVDTIKVFDATEQKLKFKFAIEKIHGGFGTIAMADVDGDHHAEIFVATGEAATAGNQGYIYCYRYDTSTKNYVFKWKSNDVYTTSVTTQGFPYLSIADFNCDGVPEILANDRIFNAVNGNLLLDCQLVANGLDYGTGAGHTSYYGAATGSRGAFSSVADMDGDGRLEIIAGRNIYKLTFNSLTNPTLNSCAVLLTANGGAARADLADGHTSVADLNLDGYLDVIVVSKPSSVIYMYAWDGKTGAMLNSNLISNVNSGASIPFVGDLDGDSVPDIAFSGSYKLYAYKYDSGAGTINPMSWSPKTTTDNSGSTTLTLFDFDQDNKMELVYRDLTHLYILDGTTGNPKMAVPVECESWTMNEYPVVADVTGDGYANIAVLGKPNGNPYNGNGFLYVFDSDLSQTGATPWAPTRKVWNQWGYNSVNINEDLSVPKYQLNPATRFPGTDGILGNNDDLRPYNGYLMQQTTIMHTSGKSVWITPDFAVSGTPNTYYYANGDSLVISNLCVRNDSDVRGADNIQIAVYRNSRAVSNMIAVYTLPAGIDLGTTRCYSIKLTGASAFSDANLLIEVNDDGNATHPQVECLYDNNGMTIAFASIPRTRNDRIKVFACGNKTVDVLANDFGFGGITPVIAKDGTLGTAALSGTDIFYKNDKTVGGGCTTHGGRRDTVIYTVCSGANCSDGSLFIEIVHMSSIRLFDSCSRRPYLTLNCQYPQTAYKWYTSPDGTSNWTEITGSQQLKLYVTAEAWYKCEITWNGETYETKPAHFVVRRKVRIPPGNVWWHETGLMEN
jgi:hypothetical protein